MYGVVFSHPNQYVGNLALRLPPISFEYEYNLNTNVVPTHGGEVVQLLSMNINRLILDGQFGTEGPHGRVLQSDNRYREPPPVDYFDLSKGRGYTKNQPLQIGLTQMTEYFRRYFNIAGPGSYQKLDGHLITANHNQQPMTIQWQTDLDSVMRRWTGYPVDFPSYSRSNDTEQSDFAPVWHLEVEVEEADKLVVRQGMPAELSRLRAAVGYEAFNPFVDVVGATLENKALTALMPTNANTLNFALTTAQQQAGQAFDEYFAILDATDPSEIAGLVKAGASAPSTTPNDPTSYDPSST